MMPILEKLHPSQWNTTAARLREQMKTPLYANASLLILTQIISAALGVLYWVLAARLYPAEVVGKNSAIISTLVFISGITELSLKSAMQRYVPRAGTKLKRLVLTTYLVNLLVTGLVAILFFIAGDFFHFTDNLFDGMSLTILGLLILVTMFWTISFVQDGVLLGLRKASWVFLNNTIYNASKIVLLVVFMSGVFGDGIVASWFLPVPLIVIVVNTLVFLRFIPRYRETNAAGGRSISTRQIVTSVSGDHIGTLLAETSVRLLPLLVLNMLGESANAYFYQAWLIGTMITLISINIASSFTVEAATNPELMSHNSRRTVRYMFFIIGPIVLVTVLFAPLILRMYGDEYSRQGAFLLRILALAAIPHAVNAWFLSYARVRADVKGIVRNQGLQMIVTLGLSFLLMPAFGINGVGIAWLAAQLTIFLVVLFTTRSILFGKDEPHEEGDTSPAAYPQSEHALQVPGTGSVNAVDPVHHNGTGPVYLFLSSHLDDAVLSCGGLIARLTASGERVIIATIFTADIPENCKISRFAKRNLRSWGLGRSSAFAKRCCEDKAAASLLGAEVVHLGLYDAMYRSRTDGTPYYPKNTVGVPINLEDAEIIGKMLQNALCQLKESYNHNRALHVFSPLGLGGHVDHALVHQSVEQVFDPETITYYEDFPYATRNGVSEKLEQYFPKRHSGTWQKTSISLTPGEMRVRIAASARYTSQMIGLFPSPFERFLEILYARITFIGKPLFRLYRSLYKVQGTHQRMIRLFTRYLSSTGGENYWKFTLDEAVVRIPYSPVCKQSGVEK